MGAIQKKMSKQLDFLAGGGETGEMIRSFDWASTSLGPVEEWSESLRTCIRIMLASRQPIWIGWGKDIIKLYNDPYRTIVGGKHPRAMGQPARIVWKDIWKDIEPLLSLAMDQQQGTYSESQLLIMERNGYPEETYYTFSYTPIPGEDGKTEGIICANTEDTERIISSRQLLTLSKLGKDLIDCNSNIEVYYQAMQVLKQNPNDFPFALMYELDPNSNTLQLVASTESDISDYNIPRQLKATQHMDLFDSMMKAVEENKPQYLKDIKSSLGKMPKGAWTIHPENAYVIPLTESGKKQVFGFLVLGLNPYRLFNEGYRSFFELVADQIAMHLSDIYALDREKKRAESLAELDRAKTVFFSNISHEFRTPLTLMISPIEEILNKEILSVEARENLNISLRNTRRLQKLVNNLLDFSRIEAGRMDADYEGVDIRELTEDLASSFRSAIEKAGLVLEVNIQSITEPVYVDREMWEKIVLNLLSNAFKYTAKGRIGVELREVDQYVELRVKDTGIGISLPEQKKIFDRFHRVPHAEGRTMEGSGIGLSLVKELVKMHGGKIEVQSEPGEWSEFIVTIPTGDIHLPAEKIRVSRVDDKYSPNGVQIDSFLSNIISVGADTPPPIQVDGQSTILIADDNGDMREYLQRLLAPKHRVLMANNGEEAYNLVLQHKVDLIISDIMMPGLDGFGLLQKVKYDSETRNIPIIFLSARAGEEAKIEGIEAGADDYLVKPFSARELIAKVDANIKISISRNYAERHLYSLLMQAPVAIAIYRGPDFVVELVNDRMLEFYGCDREKVLNKPIFEVFPEVAANGVLELHHSVYESGARVEAREQLHQYYKNGNWYSGYFNTVFEPLRDLNGSITGMIVTGADVTDEVLNRKKIEENEQKLNSILQQAPVAMAILRGRDLVVDIVNDKALEIAGKNREQVINRAMFDIFPEMKGRGYEETFYTIFDTGNRVIRTEYEVPLFKNGLWDLGWFNTVMEPIIEADGTVGSILIVTIEVTEQVLARQSIEEGRQELNELANAVPQLVWMAKADGKVTYYNDRISEYDGVRKIDGLWEWHSTLHPDDLENTQRAWIQAVEKGTIYSVEHRIKMSDGSFKWHLSRALPQKDKNGQVIKWFGTATDIDEAKKLSRQKDEFMGIVSHELKTPVTSIKAYTQLLEQKFSTVGDDVSSTLMRRMDNQINKLSALINDLLDITKLDEGKLVFRNENFSCIDLVNEVVEELQRTTNSHDIVKEFFSNCHLEGDRERIGQVLTNFISNAIKYSPKANKIIVRLEEAEGEMICSVQDFGIGMLPEKQSRIFDRFYRVEGDTLDTFPGLGLGLYISSEIIKRQNGKIWFESVPQKGSTFYFSLPAYKHEN